MNKKSESKDVMNKIFMQKPSRIIVSLLLMVFSANVWGQKVVLSGTVTNGNTGEPVPYASVTAGENGVAVVTNDDGFFTLKVEQMPKDITVSSIGFRSQRVKIAGNAENMTIRLKPSAKMLREVVVWTGDPRELVNIAIRKIPENYSRQPELYNCFYRETAMKRKHFIYVAEGVIDMYKTSYTRSDAKDRVAIRKGRRLLSPKRSDTLSVKVNGGPVQPICLDIVKNHDILLNEEELACYDFKMEQPEVIDDRLQYVVSISPRWVMPYPLYHGKLYIDRQNLAFTRAELSLDMSNREKATRFMLVHKPAGVRFRPKELTSLVDYRYENGVTRISYIRNLFRFTCDWKRRLFATSFTACCEMVVTDKTADNVTPISGRDSFDSRDAFYDKVDYFRDPNFWEDYNIIEPTVSLDEAIGKLLKKYK